jgi:excisionase family DNA binding protein
VTVNVGRDEPLTVSVRQAAARLGFGRDSMYELVRTGRVRSVRVGRRIVIPVAELQAFLERETAKVNP